MNDLIIASEHSWIEGNAVEQFMKTLELPGMIKGKGMPDLHPGKGCPIGAAFACELVYPHLVDNDIGCGMAFWQTKMRRTKLKLDKMVRRLRGLEGPWEGDIQAFLQEEKIDSTAFDSSIGTIGRGNHFAELQQLNGIEDEALFNSLGYDAKALFVLVHSGSRGYGESILHANAAKNGNTGLNETSPDAKDYLTAHDHAVRWAKANRKLIAHRFMDALGTDGEIKLDVCHNCVKRAHVDGKPCWLHRKGAAPSDEGPVVIPGSRGTLTYLVVPTGDQTNNLASVAHGAGRKMRRGECRGKLERRFTREDLQRTELGGRVICEDKDLLFEEAPQAYKNIDVVVQDLVDVGVIRVVATFAPLISYKLKKREDEDE